MSASNLLPADSPDPTARSEGRLIAILIAPCASAAMAGLDVVEAVAGVGLLGDRYASGAGTFSPSPQRPDFEVTLVEQENLDHYARESGAEFHASMARRNLVTHGIDLNALVGREFQVGEVRLRGMRLCEPCNHLAKATHAGILPGLLHRGGLRAAIVEGGTVHVGDIVRPIPQPNPVAV
jgi:hypothetical protein